MCLPALKRYYTWPFFCYGPPVLTHLKYLDRYVYLTWISWLKVINCHWKGKEKEEIYPLFHFCPLDVFYGSKKIWQRDIFLISKKFDKVSYVLIQFCAKKIFIHWIESSVQFKCDVTDSVMAGHFCLENLCLIFLIGKTNH